MNASTEGGVTMIATGTGSDARALRKSPDPQDTNTLHAKPANDHDAGLAVSRAGLTPKMRAFLDSADRTYEKPTLVVDLDVVAENYRTLARALPLAGIFYAVKANPAPEILRALAALGSSFDAASWGEIELCLSLGISPHKISFGNTIKRTQDIAKAANAGVNVFAVDSREEIDKIATHAPGSEVFCRILMECAGADWPLSRKFGCAPSQAVGLLTHAREQGLSAVGLSFHVGSQQQDLSQWDKAIGLVADLFADAEKAGLSLSLVNLGGGFAGVYRGNAPSSEEHSEAIMIAMRKHFTGRIGRPLPRMIVEPGRGMVADAGVIEAEVVLVSRKGDGDDRRWVYLDIGKFSGLAETMDEAIKYRFETNHDDGPMGPVIIAGPTCDSVDVLYEKTHYELPLELACGDRIRILSTGAYTTTYSSVAFNGFPPLASICI